MEKEFIFNEIVGKNTPKLQRSRKYEAKRNFSDTSGQFKNQRFTWFLIDGDNFSKIGLFLQELIKTLSLPVL